VEVEIESAKCRELRMLTTEGILITAKRVLPALNDAVIVGPKARRRSARKA